MKVSACIIAYNLENFIADAIEGALAQKLDCSYEIVVSDDCSKDKTRDIIIGYQKKYPNKIRAILNEKNLGMTGNWINTIKSCEGEYIAICEGDDYWTDPLKLQMQINELEKHPECDMSFHPTIIKYMDGSRADHMKAYYGDSVKIFDTKKTILVGGSFCPTASLVFRKRVVDDILRFEPSFNVSESNDYLLQIFGSLRGGLLYLGKCMSVYRYGVINSWTDQHKSFEKNLKYTRRSNEILERLNRYLGYRYSKEIEYKITLTNYTIWRKFIRLNKKDFENYENIKKEVADLKIDKKIMVKIILASIGTKIKKILKYIFS